MVTGSLGVMPSCGWIADLAVAANGCTQQSRPQPRIIWSAGIRDRTGPRYYFAGRLEALCLVERLPGLRPRPTLIASERRISA